MFYLIGVIVNNNTGRKTVGSFGNISRNVLAYSELHILDNSDGVTEAYTVEEAIKIANIVKIQGYNRENNTCKFLKPMSLFKGRFCITQDFNIIYNDNTIISVKSKSEFVLISGFCEKNIVISRTGADCTISSVYISYSQKIGDYFVVTVSIDIGMSYIVGKTVDTFKMQLVLSDKEFLGLYSAGFGGLDNGGIVPIEWGIKDKSLIARLHVAGIIGEMNFKPISGEYF